MCNWHEMSIGMKAMELSSNTSILLGMKGPEVGELRPSR